MSVSIAIPCYNYARFLGRAIASALAQTHPVDEVVVIENASFDESYAVAAAFAQRDARVRVVRQLRTVPGGINWNRGIEETRGEWFCLLSADDMLHPEFVAATLERARSSARIVLVQADYAIVDGDDCVVSAAEGPWRYHGEAFRGTAMPGTAASEASLRRGDNSFGTPSMHLVRRDAAVAAGGWDHELSWLADWDFTLRLFAQGEYAHVPRSLTFYRTHASMGTNVNGATMEPIEGPFQFLRKLAAPVHPYGPLDPAAIEAYRRTVAAKVVAVLERAQQAGAAAVAARLLEMARDPVFRGVLVHG